MVKIAPAIVGAAKKLMSDQNYSMRKSAEVLGVSPSGLTRAISNKQKPRKRGRKPALTNQVIKKIKRLRDRITRVGGNPTATFCIRKLKLTNRKTKRRMSTRSVQRILKTNGNEYCPRPKKG